MENKTIRDYLEEKQKEKKSYFWKAFCIIILIILLALPTCYFMSDKYVNDTMKSKSYIEGLNGGRITLKLVYKQNKLLLVCKVINVWGRNLLDDNFITVTLEDKDEFIIRKVRFKQNSFLEETFTVNDTEYTSTTVIPITREEAKQIKSISYSYPSFLFEK